MAPYVETGLKSTIFCSQIRRRHVFFVSLSADRPQQVTPVVLVSVPSVTSSVTSEVDVTLLETISKWKKKRMPRLTQPRTDEPIRLIETGAGWRYEATVTTSAPGARRTQARRRFATLKEARAFVARARTEVGSGTFHQRSDMTLSQLGELWLASKSRPRQSTREGYREIYAGRSATTAIVRCSS